MAGVGEHRLDVARGAAAAATRAWVALVAAVSGVVLALVLVLSGTAAPLVSSGPEELLLVPVACVVSFVAGRWSVRHVADVWVGVPPLDAQLRRELDRSRRHGHSVAVVRPPLGFHDAAVLGRLLRSTDHLAVDGGVPYIVMPETTAAQARAWLARACGALGTAETARVVAFPDDELTAAGLLDALRARPVLTHA